MERVNSKRTIHEKLSSGSSLLGIGAAIVFFAGTVAVSPAYAQAQGARIQQSEQILQPSGEVDEHDQFGSAVALSGKTMVIGAETSDGRVAGAGAAFIFDKVDNHWVQTAKLFADDGNAFPAAGRPGEFTSDSFGLTVAISEDGNTVVIGAPNHNHGTTFPGGDQGAVYVFQRVNGVWSQQTELLSPNPNRNDNFGNTSDSGGLAISGGTIVVTDQGNFITGAPAAVDVFTRTNSVWSLATQLFVPDDPAFLPSGVAFDGHTLAVGSDFSNNSSGAVYVFRLNQGQWSAPVTLAASDATPGALFGFNVSLSGNLIAVGAASGPGATAQSGAAYVFANEEGVWSQTAKLSASDGLDGDDFGSFISISGHTVLVGAFDHTPPATGIFFAGAAYVFQLGDGRWRQIAVLTASDGISGGTFGFGGVAVQNNTLLVGASGQHPPVEGYAGGEAYVYNLNP
jgi:hypothetical protein